MSPHHTSDVTPAEHEQHDEPAHEHAGAALAACGCAHEDVCEAEAEQQRQQRHCLLLDEQTERVQRDTVEHRLVLRRRRCESDRVQPQQISHQHAAQREAAQDVERHRALVGADRP
jgi:hypothetical protein